MFVNLASNLVRILSIVVVFFKCPLRAYPEYYVVAGRARIRTNIQSVLIVTKARDNRLIKLTRELAIYLMKKKSGDNQRGLTVYVIR